MIDFLLVIPTFNEERYIREIIPNADRVLSSMYKNYLIVIVDASSSDSTLKMAKEMSVRFKHLRILKSADPGNRGRDVLKGMHNYKSRIYCYIDADLSPSVGHIKDLLKQYDRGYDVILASRYKKGNLLKRPPLRKAVSLAYNKIINILFNESVMDHQCGFKLFSSGAFEFIYKNSKENHWVWDTEVILLAHYGEMKIREVPVNWEERRTNRTGLKRLLKDILIFIPGITRLFYRFRIRNEF